MKRAIVTGAGGFVGQYSIPCLKDAGYEIHGITTKKSHCDLDPDVIWHIANLLDDGQCHDVIKEVRPTHLLHFAWYTEPGKYWDSEKNVEWLTSGMRLLVHFKESGGERAVFAGTCAEYDWDYGFCSENVTPSNPKTLYGICKNSLRQMANSYSERSGLGFAWGRIFFLYGPGEQPSRLVPSVITSLLSGREALCTHGDQVRDFLYSPDVASAFVALLDSDVTGTVNIASGEPVKLKDIVSKIGSRTGHSDLIRLGALEAPAGDPPLIVADTRRLNDEVGWTPGHSLDEGLDATVEWWRRKLNSGS